MEEYQLILFLSSKYCNSLNFCRFKDNCAGNYGFHQTVVLKISSSQKLALWYPYFLIIQNTFRMKETGWSINILD